MKHFSRRVRRVAMAACPALALAVAGSASPAAIATTNEDDKPSIRLKASPIVSFAPSRVVLTAEVKGGANDYEDFYCATVEWDWGDGTKAEAKTDCEPYEAGKSEIRRRYTSDHVFRSGGDYNVQFRLKQKNKTVGTGRTSVKVRPGLTDGFDDRDRWPQN